VWRYLTDPGNGAGRAVLLADSEATARDAAVGMVAGIVTALVVAVSFALWRPVRTTLLPLAMALRAVPLVAMTPLIAHIFGRALLGVTVIVGIVTFFPVLVNVSIALRSVPASSLELMRAYGASPYATLWRVQLPTAVPALFASIRIAAPLALVGALLAEWLVTGDGLGYRMLTATTNFDYDKLWSAVTLVTVASILLYTLVSIVEQLALTRYAPEHTRRTL
jgi:ABC-type nitrate/sulfonate/bicarbonate transport system permease component